MREIVMDTETTGFDPKTGDRMVEIGAVELMNHMPTGRTYHQYINPERDMPQGAFEVHGLSAEFLSDFPVFREIGQAFPRFHRRCAAGHPQCGVRHPVPECRAGMGRPADHPHVPRGGHAADRAQEISRLARLP